MFRKCKYDYTEHGYAILGNFKGQNWIQQWLGANGCLQCDITFIKVSSRHCLSHYATRCTLCMAVIDRTHFR